MLSAVQIINDTLPALVKLRDSGKASTQSSCLPAQLLTSQYSSADC